MQGNEQHVSASSASVSPTQTDFVKFLQKCAGSPHPLKKQPATASNIGDGSAFASPELLADTLLNWDASARLEGFDRSETPSWTALRVQLQQQGFPHDSLPQHMPYSSHADACIRGILGDVLVQYSLRGQLVQQLIDTVEFASMHDTHSSIINGSNASAAHELSRVLETNQFRNFEEAAVQRATEQSLRQQLRQAETDLQSSKERNRQLRSQVSDLEEEVHLMTRQMTKLKCNSTPVTAASGNGRWQPPQVQLFKLPSAASSPAHPAAATSKLQDLPSLVRENDRLKDKLASVEALYEELRQSTSRRQQEQEQEQGSALQRSCSPMPSSVTSANVAVETEGSSKLFSEEMFRMFNVANYSACCRVARATLQLANAVPHLQSFAADVSDLCRLFSPHASLDSTAETIQVLRTMCSRLSELSAIQSSVKSHGSRHQLEQRSGLAVVSVGNSHFDATDANSSCSNAARQSHTFDGSNLVFFTGPHSEDSLATSPLPPQASAAAPSAGVPPQPRHNLEPQGASEHVAVAQAMNLVGCPRPEEFLSRLEQLLVQREELQQLRAVLTRRLHLSDPCATVVDAELGSRHFQNAAAADGKENHTRIVLSDPDVMLLPEVVSGAHNEQPLLDSPSSCTQQSLAWDIVMQPARRPKPKLTSKPISSHALHTEHPRDREPPRRASSARKQHSAQHAEAGFSQQLFANFKRRLLSQNSSAAEQLLGASRKQHSGASQHAF